MTDEEQALEIPLGPEAEVRFEMPPQSEVPPGARVTLRVQKLPTGAEHQVGATAEVFGAPLVTDTPYPLSGGLSFPVFSFQGCTLELRGRAALLQKINIYRPTATVQKALAELHATVIQPQRKAAQDKATALYGSDAAAAAQNQRKRPPSECWGPRVVICGGRSTGKHAATKTLANYAARLGWSATVADLDPSHQFLQSSVPGAVSAAVWEYPTTPDCDTLNLVTSAWFTGNDAVCTRVPAATAVATTPQAAAATEVLFDEEPISSLSPLSPTYLRAVSTAADALRDRLARNAKGPYGWSGCLVAVPHVAGLEQSRTLVADVANRIDASVIVVIGHDSLHAALADRFAPSAFVGADGGQHRSGGGNNDFRTRHGTPLQIVRLSPSSGATDYSSSPARDRGYRSLRLSQYLHGFPDVAEMMAGRRHVPFGRVASVVRFVDKRVASDSSVTTASGHQSITVTISQQLYPSLTGRIVAIYTEKADLQRDPAHWFGVIDRVDPDAFEVMCGQSVPDKERLVLAIGPVVRLDN